VCGEILAALCSVQAEGMVYGDLKPENVLITEAGHVKLGDFGGCRAVGREAREVLRGAMSAVDKLRDGDWRVREESKGGGVDLDGGEEVSTGRGAERMLERSESKSIIPPSYITNNLPLVASLLPTRRRKTRESKARQRTCHRRLSAGVNTGTLPTCGASDAWCFSASLESPP